MKITSLLPPSLVSLSKQTNKQKSETDGLVRVQSSRQRDPGPFAFPPGGEAVQLGGGRVRDGGGGWTCCLLL